MRSVILFVQFKKIPTPFFQLRRAYMKLKCA